MSERKLGQDFENILIKAREIPEVREHLDSFSTIVANTVFARRLQLKLTQHELADLSKSTQGTISRIESGDTGVKLETLNSVFRILKINNISFVYDEEAAASYK